MFSYKVGWVEKPILAQKAINGKQINIDKEVIRLSRKLSK